MPGANIKIDGYMFSKPSVKVMTKLNITNVTNHKTYKKVKGDKEVLQTTNVTRFAISLLISVSGIPLQNIS